MTSSFPLFALHIFSFLSFTSIFISSLSVLLSACPSFISFNIFYISFLLVASLISKLLSFPPPLTFYSCQPLFSFLIFHLPVFLTTFLSSFILFHNEETVGGREGEKEGGNGRSVAAVSHERARGKKKGSCGF